MRSGHGHPPTLTSTRSFPHFPNEHPQLQAFIQFLKSVDGRCRSEEQAEAGNLVQGSQATQEAAATTLVNVIITLNQRCRHNTDITKDLHPESLVAVNHPDWVGTVPQISRVLHTNLAENPDVEISWLEHKKSSKTAIWLPGFERLPSAQRQQFT